MRVRGGRYHPQRLAREHYHASCTTDPKSGGRNDLSRNAPQRHATTRVYGQGCTTDAVESFVLCLVHRRNGQISHSRGHFTLPNATSFIARARGFDGAHRPPRALNRLLALTTAVPAPGSIFNSLSSGVMATSKRLDCCC